MEGKVEETVGTTTVEEARNETFTEERESPRLVTVFTSPSKKTLPLEYFQRIKNQFY